MTNDNVPGRTPAERTPHAGHAGLLDEKTFGKYFLLALFLLSLFAFYRIISYFLLEIVIAAVAATLFYPLFERIVRWCGGRRGIAAFASCVIILLGILIPIVLISNIVVLQGLDLYHTAEPQIKELLQKAGSGGIGQLGESRAGRFLSQYNINWQAALNNGINFLGGILARAINVTSQKAFKTIADLFIILFSIFYFLRDGGRILARIKEVIPLNEEYKSLLVSRFSAISSATVKGTLLIALIQSSLGTIMLWIFGIKAWLLWGVVMLVFALIPFVGTGAVLVPAGIITILSGEVWQGIVIICVSIFVISTIDNFLRPRLVGQNAGIHDLLVFFSSLGGILAVGPAGFIVGPLIAAFFLTLLDIFSIEFQEHIEYPNR